MRIAVDGIIFEQQGMGGISRLFQMILPLMCEQDPDLHIDLYLAGSARTNLPEHRQITVRHILPLARIMRPGRLWRSQWAGARGVALRLAIGRQQDTIWHSTYYTQPWDCSMPKVVTVHDLIHEKYPHLFNAKDRQLQITAMRTTIQQADIIICVSQTTSRELQNLYGVSSSKIRVVPHAAAPVFRLDHKNTSMAVSLTSKPYLLYVGARAGYKNFNMLLNAYARWHLHSNINLLVVGHPWHLNERKKIQELHLTPHIHLLSQVDDEQLAGLYSGAFAFIYPSLDEGFGIPLLEAMACGTRIIASRISSTLEVAADYPIYFDPHLIDSLTAALDTAYTTSLSKSQHQTGLQLASQYSWEATATATLNAYYEILGQP